MLKFTAEYCCSFDGIYTSVPGLPELYHVPFDTVRRVHGLALNQVSIGCSVRGKYNQMTKTSQCTLAILNLILVEMIGVFTKGEAHLLDAFVFVNVSDN